MIPRNSVIVNTKFMDFNSFVGLHKNGGIFLVNLYNRLNMFCEEKGISLYQMCKDLGFPVSTTTDLKMGRTKTLSQKKLEKISEYFGVSIDFLLGKSPSPREDGKVMIPVYGKSPQAFPAIWSSILRTLRK